MIFLKISSSLSAISSFASELEAKSTLAPQSFKIYSNSFVFKKVFIGTATAPIAVRARYEMINSFEFATAIATLSPKFTPQSCK